jgi:hypothetical protein
MLAVLHLSVFIRLASDTAKATMLHVGYCTWELDQAVLL